MESPSKLVVFFECLGMKLHPSLYSNVPHATCLGGGTLVQDSILYSIILLYSVNEKNWIVTTWSSKNVTCPPQFYSVEKATRRQLAYSPLQYTMFLYIFIFSHLLPCILCQLSISRPMNSPKLPSVCARSIETIQAHFTKRWMGHTVLIKQPNPSTAMCFHPACRRGCLTHLLLCSTLFTGAVHKIDIVLLTNTLVSSNQKRGYLWMRLKSPSLKVQVSIYANISLKAGVLI